MKLGDLVPIAITLLVAVIAVSVGAQILDSVGEGQCLSGQTWNSTIGACCNDSGAFNASGMSAAANASNYGLQGLGELGSWWSTIALVVAAAIVIGVLVSAFAMRR